MFPFSFFKYNYFLALVIAAAVVYVVTHLGDFSQSDEDDVNEVIRFLVIGSLTLFGFFGSFHSFLGALYRLASFVVIGMFILSMSSNIEDEMIVRMVNIGMTLFMGFGLLGFIMHTLKKR